MSVPFSTQQFEKKRNPKIPRTTVRVDKIVATQIKLDQAKVKHLAALDSSDIDSDPIVFPFGGKYILGDGHHRVAAAKKKGDKYIPVRRVR